MDQTQAVENSLKAVVAKVLQIPEDRVRPECRFKEDLGADSLDLVLLLYEIEDRLGFAIPDEDAKQLATVADATRLALRLLNRT
jgi:acyl carrier protein